MKSTGLYSGNRCFRLLQRSCTKQQNLLINFHRLASPAKLTSNWYNNSQQAKAHTHRCCQEGVDQSFVALLPLMAKQWSHLGNSSILEILRVTAHFRPLCLSVRPCAKNNWYFKARKLRKKA